MAEDTIFALASGPGRAGVAVYRLSGPLAGPAVRALTGRDLPPPRRARRALVRDGGSIPIDDGLVLWFPGPASFTGEDVAEFHVHGGVAVGAALAAALLGLGLRPAEPGEFSRRAFAAGKLDLVQAEGLADLVAAETEQQRRQALGQLGGALSHLYDGWRERLLTIQAHAEAAIDFADEDLPGSLAARNHAAIVDLADDIALHLADNQRGEVLRAGLRVAIVGAPNVGKSSLLNRLARRDAAIVSARPGTTRDVIEINLDVGGYPVTVADTAGLRHTDDEVEGEGVRRALARAAAADLRLVVFDATRLPALDEDSLAQIDSAALVVVNKTDRATKPVPAAIGGRPALAVSALTGDGFAGVDAALAAAAADRLGGSATPALTRGRHRQALEQALAALWSSLDAPLPELAAEDVRTAIRALGRITGRVDVEDVLGAIFSEFCIGK